MKLTELTKSIIVAILIPLIFFSALELTQRIRWYFKSSRSVYWLKYGFVPRPKDFDQQLTKIAMNKMSGQNTNIQEIQIWSKEFPNGIKKHNPDYPEYKNLVNSLGFRSHEFEPRKDPNTYRIIATGGSTTAGYESDIEHTYPAILEKKLNRDAKRYEVINAGLGEQELPYINYLLEKELIGYKPDMVTLYSTFNHLYMFRSSVNVPRDFHYKIFHFKEWLSTKSLLFLTVWEKFNILFKPRRYALSDIYIPTNDSKRLAKAFLDTPEVFESYKRGLEKFVATCRENHITPVLITEACVFKNEAYLLLGKGMDPVYNKMYDIMEEVAIKNNAIFIDAARVMNNIPGHEALYTDGLHFKPEGNDVLAEIIYAALKDRLTHDANILTTGGVKKTLQTV